MQHTTLQKNNLEYVTVVLFFVDRKLCKASIVESGHPLFEWALAQIGKGVIAREAADNYSCVICTPAIHGGRAPTAFYQDWCSTSARKAFMDAQERRSASGW
jgi:hypothetical protein